MLCYPFQLNGKKFCIPVLQLIPIPSFGPGPDGPVDPDGYKPHPRPWESALGLTEESLRTLAGLALTEYAISLLPRAQQAGLHDAFTKVATEQQRLGLPVQVA